MSKHIPAKEYTMKESTYKLVRCVLIAGFIFPLFAEVCVGTICPERSQALTTWNQFTSIILGVIATVLSLVSMFMGFKSYDDSAKLQETCIETLTRLEAVSKDVDALRAQAGMAHNITTEESNNKWGTSSVEQHH